MSSESNFDVKHQRLGEGGNSLAYFSLAEQREVKKG